MGRRLAVIAGVLGVCAGAYLLVGLTGPLGFVLPYRAGKLAALALVAVALSVATVLFQTITANRILTPSLMGFDALYVLVLTIMVQALGTSGFAALSPLTLFAINLAGLAGLGLALFAVLMRLAKGDMVRLCLTGVVLGLLIRSATQLLQRLIDPGDYQVVQSLSVARFTQIDGTLLAIAAAAVGAGVALAWRLRHRLDVLALGDATATGLGEPPARLQRQTLLLICLLVGSATALAGPMASGGFGPSSFFGLVVVAFARLVIPTHRHAVLIPAAALIGAVVLIGGQLVLERLLSLSTPLIVVIELIGGATFLILLLKRRAA
jgi:iron complex transport system permease protein